MTEAAIRYDVFKQSLIQQEEVFYSSLQQVTDLFPILLSILRLVEPLS